MFIPSIYKSTPQVIAAAFGTNAISSVNRSYSRETLLGWGTGSDFGQLVSDSQCRYKITSNTTLEVYSVGDVSAGTPLLNILIEEYLPFFFRQAFYRNDITIADTDSNNTLNTGLSLGSKAFVLHLGNSSNIPAPPIRAERQVNCTLSLNRATGVVTASRVGDASVNGGTLTTSFLVIDPK
jgi:hypothetical protein